MLISESVTVISLVSSHNQNPVKFWSQCDTMCTWCTAVCGRGVDWQSGNWRWEWSPADSRL